MYCSICGKKLQNDGSCESCQAAEVKMIQETNRSIKPITLVFFISFTIFIIVMIFFFIPMPSMSINGKPGPLFHGMAHGGCFTAIVGVISALTSIISGIMALVSNDKNSTY